MSTKKGTKETAGPEGFSTRLVMAMASDVVDLVRAADRTRLGFETLAREHGVKVVFD